MFLRPALPVMTGDRSVFGTFGKLAAGRAAAALLLAFAGLAGLPRGAGAADAEGLRRELGVAFPGIEPITRPGRADEHDLGLSSTDEDIHAVLARIAEAEAASSQRQWVKAAGKFQDVLDRHGEALVPAGGGRYVPAWRYCTVRLLALGPAARAAYRASYGAAARAALEAARSARSRRGLTAVARRYGATTSGLRALDVLASLDLEHGRAGSAARQCLRRIELDPTRARPEPRLIAKLAVALARSGRGEALEKLAGTAAKHYRREGFAHEGRRIELAAFVRGQLEGMVRGSDGGPSSAAYDAVRPGLLLWRVPLPAAPGVRSSLVVPPPVKAVSPEFAAFRPVIGRGVVYCQSRDAVRAIDRFTGRVFWSIDLPRWWSRRTVRLPDRAQPVHRAAGVVSPSLAGGDLLVSFTTVGSSGPFSVAHFGRIDAFPVSSLKRPESTLGSVSTATESGPLRPDQWQMPLRFVSRAVRMGRTVCVAARGSSSDSEAYLLGYDLSAERCLWRTRVGAGGWAGQSGALARLTEGSPVVEHAGLACYGSDLGTVAAVDPADGSLVWLLKYPRKDVLVRTLTTVGGQTLATTAPPNEPIAADGLLFVLPADSEELLALDAATGAVKWRRSRDDGHVKTLYLLAVHDGRVYLSGSAALCLDAATGKTLWRSVPFRAFPVGRGVLARDYLMCPVQRGIEMVDLRREGRLAEPVDWHGWRRVPAGSGNLTLLDGTLLVTRNDSLSAFAAKDAESRLRAAAGKRPTAAEPRLELAALYASGGRWSEAAGAYRAALPLLEARGAASGERAAFVRGLLVEALLEQAGGHETDGRWPEAAKVLGQVLALDRAPGPRRSLTAVRRARALVRTGEVKGGLAILHGVLGTAGDLELALPGGLFGGPSGRTVRADVLAAEQIAGVLRERGPAAYAPYEAEAAKAVKSAPSAEAAFQTVSRRYPNSGAAGELRLARAGRAIAVRRFASAAGELLAVERLCPGVKAGEVARERARLAASQRRPAAPAPEGRGKLLSTVWSRPLTARTTAASVAELGAGGPGRGEADHLMLARGKSLRAYDPASGKLAWRTGVGFLGVTFQAGGIAPSGMPRPAVEFIQVVKGYAAERAGAKAGDLLVSFGGRRIRDKNDLIQVCGTTQPGTEVELVVLRREGARPGGAGPRTRRVVLRAVIGDRPEQIREPDAANGLRSLPVNVHESARVVGVEGDTVIAETDLALLWINRSTGRIVRRAIVGGLPDQDWRVSAARDRVSAARGHRPVLGSGSVLATKPAGGVMCFDLAGRRRWSCRLSATPGGETGLAVLRMRAWNGRTAVLAGPRLGAVRPFKPHLFVFDTFGGAEFFHVGFDLSGMLDECRLVPADDKLVVSVPGRLFCYDAATGRQQWELKAQDLTGTRFPEVLYHAGKVVAVVNWRVVVVVDLATGKVEWRKQSKGSIRRVVVDGGPKPGEERLFVAQESDAKYSVECYKTMTGGRLWKTQVAADVWLGHRIPVPFAEVVDGRLFLVQHLTDDERRTQPPSIAAIRVSDGALLKYVSLEQGGRYNKVFGGKTRGGVIGLITGSGLIGLSAGGK